MQGGHTLPPAESCGPCCRSPPNPANSAQCPMSAVNHFSADRAIVMLIGDVNSPWWVLREGSSSRGATGIRNCFQRWYSRLLRGSSVARAAGVDRGRCEQALRHAVWMFTLLDNLYMVLFCRGTRMRGRNQEQIAPLAALGYANVA